MHLFITSLRFVIHRKNNVEILIYLKTTLHLDYDTGKLK